MVIHPSAIISLCAGIGGIDLGLRLAIPTARTVCYVEREATAAAILAARFEDGSMDPAPIWSDLRTFDGRPWRGRVDTIIAGYPCQPFSCAGKQRGTKDPRHLWPEVARIIREIEPRFVFLENVSNHQNIGFREVARELQGMGYRLEAGLFTAAEVGASHLRKRLFALAYRESGGCGIVRQPSRRGGLTNGNGSPVANAGVGLVPIAGRGSQRRGRARSTGEALADTQRESGAAGQELHEVGRAHQTTRFTNRGGSLADSTSSRFSKRRDRPGDSGAASRNAATERASVSLFPPGPADSDGWRRLLAVDPTLKPAIRRAFDGFPSRVDRLRCLGNGVVPLVAALAYRTLRARLAVGA